MSANWMPFHGSPWVPLLASVGILIALYRLRSARAVLFPIAVYYFYLSFGPVISYLLGMPIYKGTVETKIYTAGVVFFLALAGLAAGALITRRSHEGEFSDSFTRVGRYTAIPVVIGGLCLYPIYVTLVHGMLLLGVSKPDRISLVNPSWHYAYLLAEFYVGALYFIARRERSWLLLLYVNLALYVAYCVIMSERDFMFIAAGIALHRIVLDGMRWTPRMIIGAFAMLYGATYMFQMRFAQSDVGVANILNQGSLLFVDSYVIHLIDSGVPLMHGASYLDALLGLLPGPLHQTGLSLNAWLVDMYAPGSASQYGFSLSAEAYLNFGMWGVLVVFALIAFVQGKLLALAKRHPALSYASVFYTSFMLYAFRGDSRMLFSGCLYAALFFAVLEVTAVPERVYRRSERRRRAGVSLSPAS